MARWNPKSTEKTMMIIFGLFKTRAPKSYGFYLVVLSKLVALWSIPCQTRPNLVFCCLYIPWNIANWFHDMSIIATLSHEDPMKRVFLIPWDLQINSILITNVGKTMP